MLGSLALAGMLVAGSPKPALEVRVEASCHGEGLDADGQAAFEEHLAEELGWFAVDHGRSGGTTLTLRCELDSVRLRVEDPASEASASRRHVHDPASQNPLEALAWTAAALVRSVWLGPELAPAPETPTRRRARRVARRPPVPWHLGDGFVVRSFLGADTPALMLGEQVEVIHRPTRHFAWKAEGELTFFRVPVEEDGVSDRIRTFTVSVAPALLSYAQWRSQRPRGAGTVGVYGGAGLRVGGVRMRSAAFGDSGGYQPFLGPMATARVSVATGRFVGLAVNAEAGWLLLGPERPGRVPLSLRGPWVNGVVVLISSF
ncbi:Holliday junction DNA helicase B [Plesiocystis pacifica SIR-1]|uniref:Holliday junction DNA helicase B n=1 Tax=Plesiocystis pacifica SIR-1 TaxID=391625 RepID=A6G1D3_9BACT|nr:hypothetical protein [Plesiocystis pacifica]EDM80428.1 Holliday junction DNA helicase B [Plesiocystis pacifica SIR-1]